MGSKGKAFEPDLRENGLWGIWVVELMGGRNLGASAVGCA